MRRRTARGFTLIELTIALVLLAFGLLALTGALATALRETTRARLVHAALRRAESVADSIALQTSSSTGSATFSGFTLEWQPYACGAPCVRVVARIAADSFALVAALQPDTAP